MLVRSVSLSSAGPGSSGGTDAPSATAGSGTLTANVSLVVFQHAKAQSAAGTGAGAAGSTAATTTAPTTTAPPATTAPGSATTRR